MDFLKLNVDGAWKEEWQMAGIGGVFRDKKGKWKFGFAKKIEAISPEAAELLAIREGLQIAWDCCYPKMEVECDALGVVQLLAKPTEATNHPLGIVISDINILIARDWCVEFIHSRRESNMVAHGLAAVDQKDTRVVYVRIPEHVREVYLRDLEYVPNSSN
ncbi:hypothetical protein BVRB_6g134410 [Beta vulgaris subsp. vulgaris]|nr:hypothetical protein BVRB_6g134410 [Beta vulgaris subsp. vulgaris]